MAPCLQAFGALDEDWGSSDLGTHMMSANQFLY